MEAVAGLPPGPHRGTEPRAGVCRPTFILEGEVYPVKPFQARVGCVGILEDPSEPANSVIRTRIFREHATGVRSRCAEGGGEVEFVFEKNPSRYGGSTSENGRWPKSCVLV